MAKKFQVPVVGGIRKVIRVQDQSADLATLDAQIAALEAAVAALQSQTRQPNTQSTSSPASLQPGPGLGGGGPLTGNVPIYITAPIPYGIFDEGGGGDGDPGPPGLNGPAGATGPPGPVAGWFPDDGLDGNDAIPGNPGPAGGTGAPGPVGPAAFMSADDGEDGWHAVPGNVGPTGATGPPGPLYFNEEPEGEQVIAALPNPFRRVNKGANWYSNGGALTPAGCNTVYVYCPVPATIRAARMIGTVVAGSAVVDVWASTAFPPTVANSITASAKPTLSSANLYTDLVLTGWTRYLPAGTWLAFNVNSVSLFTQIELVLEIEQ